MSELLTWKRAEGSGVATSRWGESRRSSPWLVRTLISIPAFSRLYQSPFGFFPSGFRVFSPFIPLYHPCFVPYLRAMTLFFGLERRPRLVPGFSFTPSFPFHSLFLPAALLPLLVCVPLYQFNSRQNLWPAGRHALRHPPEPTRALSADAAIIEHSWRVCSSTIDTLHRALGHNLLFVL